MRTLEEIISGRLAFGRFGAIIYSSFAVLALLLASVRIYGRADTQVSPYTDSQTAPVYSTVNFHDMNASIS